jgi:hypothetical protein
MTRILTLIAALAFSATANAQHREGRARTYPLGTLLSAVPLDGSGASLTANIDLQNDRDGYDIAKLTVVHANTSGALTITMICYEDTAAGGATSVILQDCTIASGVCTSDDVSWEKDVTGAKSWPWRVDLIGYRGQVNCTFAAAGAAATDTVTVTGQLVTK